MVENLIPPSQVLTRRYIRERNRVFAVAALGDAFYDVPLSAPMTLSEREAKELTRGRPRRCVTPSRRSAVFG